MSRADIIFAFQIYTVSLTESADSAHKIVYTVSSFWIFCANSAENWTFINLSSMLKCYIFVLQSIYMCSVLRVRNLRIKTDSALFKV